MRVCTPACRSSLDGLSNSLPQTEQEYDLLVVRLSVAGVGVSSGSDPTFDLYQSKDPTITKKRMHLVTSNKSFGVFGEHVVGIRRHFNGGRVFIISSFLHDYFLFFT